MPWIKLEGGGIAHIKMARPRRKRCSYCADIGAQLECDGCDKALCRSCAVSPRDGLDYCPRCFDPAWKHWLGLQPNTAGSMERMRRRNEFRRWARKAADVFLRLVPLGAIARGTSATKT